MILTPLDRLMVHLKLTIPGARVRKIVPLGQPGMVKVTIKENRRLRDVVLDIRGVGYPARISGKYVSVYRLWSEMVEYYCHRVDVLKEKKKQPSKILWEGRVYRLDDRETFKHRKKGAKKRGR